MCTLTCGAHCLQVHVTRECSYEPIFQRRKLRLSKEGHSREVTSLMVAQTASSAGGSVQGGPLAASGNGEGSCFMAMVGGLTLDPNSDASVLRLLLTRRALPSAYHGLCALPAGRGNPWVTGTIITPVCKLRPRGQGGWAEVLGHGDTSRPASWWGQAAPAEWASWGMGTVAEGLSTRVEVRKPGLSRVLLLTLASHRTQSQTAHL